MIPAGKFTGTPVGLGAVKTLTMPASATGVPFGPPRLGGLRGATAVDSPIYAAATLLGAGLGGVLLGWVASDSREGALNAGAFAAGLTGVSSGIATWPAQRALGATLVVSGLGGMLWGVRSRIRRTRRRR